MLGGWLPLRCFFLLCSLGIYLDILLRVCQHTLPIMSTYLGVPLCTPSAWGQPVTMKPIAALLCSEQGQPFRAKASLPLPEKAGQSPVKPSPERGGFGRGRPPPWRRRGRGGSKKTGWIEKGGVVRKEGNRKTRYFTPFFCSVLFSEMNSSLSPAFSSTCPLGMMNSLPRFTSITKVPGAMFISASRLP